MLNTSQAYKDIMNGHVLYSRISIVISNGTDTITLTNKDIVKGSLKINWRGTNNKDFCFGSVYATSLTFSALQKMETEIVGNYLTVVPTLYYDIGSGAEETIPLGVFICDAPVVYIRTTAYECYDAMLQFDRNVESQMNGTPFNVISYIASRIGILLGTTQNQVDQMANSTQLCVIRPEEVDTYRDALSYVGMILGAFYQIGRDGKLYVRQFHKTSDAEVLRERRISASFAGYKTTFAGVRCRFLADQNYAPYEYIANNEGLIIDLGDIPIIQDTVDQKRKILRNIYNNALLNLEYYPCSIEMPGDPSFEPGDMITTKDREGYDKNILLTSVTFAWREPSKIVSEGGNPKQSNVSTAQRRQSKREDQIAAGAEVVTTTFVNAGQITVTNAEKEEVTNLRFETSKDLTAIFGAEIPAYSSGDGYVEIGYYNNGVQGDVVKARVHEGYNLITLVNHLYYEENSVILLQLEAQTEAIGSGTAPTLTINQDSIRSYIFAQGIVTGEIWDGIIEISEDIDYIAAQFAVYGLTDGVTVMIERPVEPTLSDIVSGITSYLNVYSQSDTVEVSLEYGDQIMRMGMGHRAGMGRMFAPITI